MGDPIYEAWSDYGAEGRLDGFKRYPADSAERDQYLQAAMAIEHSERVQARGETMGFMVRDTGNKFVLAPAGLHVAVCYSLIDCGLQDDVWDGKTITKPKVRVTWELAEELMADGRPFSVTKYYTASLASTGNLRPDLESWRGRPFTPDELIGFDLTQILGKPCMLNLIHEPKKDNPSQSKVKISSITPLAKSMQKPVASNPLYYFSLTDPDALSKYNAMEDWLKKAINAAPILKQERVGSAANPSTPANNYDDFDDDIPF